jgi:hypothetical protein
LSRRKTLTDILLHLINAVAHNSRLSLEKIESPNAQKALYPPCRRDPAQSGFFLFGYLKEKLCETSSTPNDDRICAISPFFSEILEIVLKNVLTSWITRLSRVMKKDGEY